MSDSTLVIIFMFRVLLGIWGHYLSKTKKLGHRLMGMYCFLFGIGAILGLLLLPAKGDQKSKYVRRIIGNYLLFWPVTFALPLIALAAAEVPFEIATVTALFGGSFVVLIRMLQQAMKAKTFQRVARVTYAFRPEELREVDELIATSEVSGGITLSAKHLDSKANGCYLLRVYVMKESQEVARFDCIKLSGYFSICCRLVDGTPVVTTTAETLTEGLQEAAQAAERQRIFS